MGQNRLVSESSAAHLGQICMRVNPTKIILFGPHLSYNGDMNKTILTILFVLFLLGTAAAEVIQPVDTTTAGFVGMASSGPYDQPVIVQNFTDFTTTFGASTDGLPNPYLAPSVAGFFANGGLRLAVVRVSAVDDVTVIGVDGGSPGTRTGLQALRDVDEVSFIAIPGVATPAVQMAMIAHCEETGDRMALLDPSSPNDMNAIQVQRAGLSTEKGFSALYYPWIQAAPTGTSLLLPPSGFVAGHYSAKPPGESPVGVISTATGLAYYMTDGEQDILNVQGINGIRNLSGIRIWGARTMATNIEWRYVSIRRLGCYIEESIAEGTQWSLTEPNDLTLWTTLEQDIDIFLYTLWVKGWLQGAVRTEGYFVQCGLGLTMTQADIDEGRTIMLAGWAPIFPAEFLLTHVIQQRPNLSPVSAGSGGMVLHPAAPNPFNPATTLRFELETENQVDLRIFDTSGRLVRVLVSGQTFSKGEHRLRWDGRDNSGRAVGSGVYLAKLIGNGAGRVGSQRLVLIR